ncbi:trypsin-like peptidase domain-containing protein [Candidatus Uhrbacteria bacterium]|nr:trypsin-like peptidase domain-containing protein [Candidatus Uhrbacteria bacterium]
MDKTHKKLILFLIPVFLFGSVFFDVYSSYAQANVLSKKKVSIQSVLEKRVFSLEKEIQTLKKQIASLVEEIKKLTLVQIKQRKTVSVKSREETLPQIVARVSPSVVSIVISKDVQLLEIVYRNPFGNDPLFRDFDIRVPTYRQKGTEHQKVGAGSGFIATKDGYIVTNKHVVSDQSATYTVLLPDGSKKEAKIFYVDPSDDIAIIKIDGNSYTPVPIGNSDAVQLGQSVLAIGNALGEFENSVSTGIISGLKRTIKATTSAGQIAELKNVIQTDAAINPGNSGGPLLDFSGKAIGVSVAMVVGSQNIAFAIPSNKIRDVLSLALGR